MNVYLLKFNIIIHIMYVILKSDITQSCSPVYKGDLPSLAVKKFSLVPRPSHAFQHFT